MTGQQWLVILLGLVVAWAARPYLRRLWRLLRPLPPPDVFGSAAWMPRREVRAMAQRPGLIIGREPERPGRLLRYAGEAHLMTIAPTCSGKRVGVIIPNLLTTGRSVLCIDPKGENARVTTRRRRDLGPVWVLDPFGITGEPAAACNPLDAVDPDDPIEDVATLAEALVVDPPGQVAEAHWNEEAKALIAGLLLLTPDEVRRLPRHLSVLLAAGQPPVLARKVRYHADREFQGLLEAR